MKPGIPNPHLHLISIPAGSISLRDARTATTRHVDLEAFAITDAPVTRGQYAAVSGESAVPHASDNAPVHSVSWLEAVTWCNALSLEHGFDLAYEIEGEDVAWTVSANGYRLPTEAEWEYACRAGTAGPRYGPLAAIAWADADAVAGPQDVRRKEPNAFGLYDMLGNVWEWCWDYADPARYADYRTMRGGGWADKHWSIRASVRRASMPGARLDDLGFRLAQGAVGGSEDNAGQGWSQKADRERADAHRQVTPFGWTPQRSRP